MSYLDVLKHTTEPFRAFLSGLGFQVAFETTNHGYVRVKATKGDAVCVGFLEEHKLRSEFSRNYLDAMERLFEVDVFRAVNGLKTSLWAFEERK